MEYDQNCKRCGGTGLAYGALYDPPEQCDCVRDYQPDYVDDVGKTDKVMPVRVPESILSESVRQDRDGYDRPE